jgi:MYXO-CTERM domain-containing protein
VRAALLAAASAFVFAASVSYVRTRTQSGDHCLHWPAGGVEIVQSVPGDPPLGDAGFDAVSRSWQTWEAQFQICGSLVLTEGRRSPSRSVGFVIGGRNENLLLFRTVRCSDVVDAGDPCATSASCGNAHDCWDHGASQLALTTTTYRTADGTVVDADVEFNAAEGYFTTVDGPPCDGGTESLDCVVNDTQNTATHEFGHVLGLAHSPDPASTMYATAPVGETSKRSLDPGSLQFVCDVYPRGRPSQDCAAPDAGPPGSPDAGAQGGSGGCSTAETGGLPAGGMALLLGLAALAARRRSR